MLTDRLHFLIYFLQYYGFMPTLNVELCFMVFWQKVFYLLHLYCDTPYYCFDLYYIIFHLCILYDDNVL